MSTNYVTIFDTTLRDGEQSPGATLTADEKLTIARRLELMGVDVIEAGFPVSSDGDFESVRRIAAELKTATVCGLARCVPHDIDRAGAAIEPAAKGRIHVFCATSKIHREHKLKKGQQEILDLSARSIGHARRFTDDVEFSPEDASRTEIEFLREITAVAIEAGATTINLPDTVGYATPAEYAAIFADLIRRVPENVVLSTHCHNDLGLAVANSLAAVQAGARQVECTVNGIGERAGNAALEEVVMALRTRRDALPFTTNIDAKHLVPVSKQVSRLTGLGVQRNKAIVGRNAFAHESGIHQDGVLKHRETYEIMDPVTVGLSTNDLVLGKHSGRAAFRDRAQTLGYTLSDEQLQDVFARFKTLADRKKEMHDEDVEALIDDALERTHSGWSLVTMQVVAGSHALPTASVELTSPDGEVRREAAVGDGPIDAVLNAVNLILGDTLGAAEMTDFRITATTKGRDAIGEARVELSDPTTRQAATGRGSHTDVVQATALAYIAAANRLTTHPRKLNPQHEGV